MFIPASNLVNLVYLTSIGLGGGFLAKKTASATIRSWNHCANEHRKISQQTQKKIIKNCEIIGGLFSAILAASEVFSENIILKQIKNLKTDLRDLEREVNDLFKIISNMTFLKWMKNDSL
jgi:hypothetical protein